MTIRVGDGEGPLHAAGRGFDMGEEQLEENFGKGFL
jgi:hypothetical protein